eukprot:snap_masked-scaffold_40-processed-gene-1.34-mRNA-1 protein AED:1.00 eAED:1.00 QI:0/-1/0/0/-1/1/1/0/361
MSTRKKVEQLVKDIKNGVLNSSVEFLKKSGNDQGKMFCSCLEASLVSDDFDDSALVELLERLLDGIFLNKEVEVLDCFQFQQMLYPLLDSYPASSSGFTLIWDFLFRRKNDLKEAYMLRNMANRSLRRLSPKLHAKIRGKIYSIVSYVFSANNKGGINLASEVETSNEFTKECEEKGVGEPTEQADFSVGWVTSTELRIKEALSQDINKVPMDKQLGVFQSTREDLKLWKEKKHPGEDFYLVQDKDSYQGIEIPKKNITPTLKRKRASSFYSLMLENNVQNKKLKDRTVEEQVQNMLDAIDPENGIEEEYHPKHDELYCWKTWRAIFSSPAYLIKHDNLVDANNPGDLEDFCKTLAQNQKS